MNGALVIEGIKALADKKRQLQNAQSQISDADLQYLSQRPPDFSVSNDPLALKEVPGIISRTGQQIGGDVKTLLSNIFSPGSVPVTPREPGNPLSNAYGELWDRGLKAAGINESDIEGVSNYLNLNGMGFKDPTMAPGATPAVGIGRGYVLKRLREGTIDPERWGAYKDLFTKIFKVGPEEFEATRYQQNPGRAVSQGRPTFFTPRARAEDYTYKGKRQGAQEGGQYRIDETLDPQMPLDIITPASSFGHNVIDALGSRTGGVTKMYPDPMPGAQFYSDRPSMWRSEREIMEMANRDLTSHERRRALNSFAENTSRVEAIAGSQAWDKGIDYIFKMNPRNPQEGHHTLFPTQVMETNKQTQKSRLVDLFDQFNVPQTMRNTHTINPETGEVIPMKLNRPAQAPLKDLLTEISGNKFFKDLSTADKKLVVKKITKSHRIDPSEFGSYDAKKILDSVTGNPYHPLAELKQAITDKYGEMPKDINDSVMSSLTKEWKKGKWLGSYGATEHAKGIIEKLPNEQKVPLLIKADYKFNDLPPESKAEFSKVLDNKLKEYPEYSAEAANTLLWNYKSGTGEFYKWPETSGASGGILGSKGTTETKHFTQYESIKEFIEGTNSYKTLYPDIKSDFNEALNEAYKKNPSFSHIDAVKLLHSFMD